MSPLVSEETLRLRLEEVRDRIDAARQPGQQVEIVAVTKTFPAELVRLSLAVGLRHVGENYAQDLAAKAEDLGQGPLWHFIGGLQRNKVKRLCDHVHLWQTIDRLALVEEVAKRQPGARILVQVNTTGEAQKAGCDPAETPRLVDVARAAGLAVEGLMTVGPTGGGSPQRAFSQLASLGDRLGTKELSMGMSGDFELAVEHGATIVRLGSVLFGQRS